MSQRTRHPRLISPEERLLFRAAVQDTTPLQSDQAPPYRPPVNAPSRQQQSARERAQRDDLLSDAVGAEGLTHERNLQFIRPGLQHRVVKQLRQGKLRYQAELDLHGLTIVEARLELTEFLHAVMEAGLRSVLIIHGKGYGSEGQTPVLKRKVNYWLRQRHEVLAFCTAQPCDGGEGALYLLLRSAPYQPR